ncbi:MAG: Asp-tRNA(Asn)/Glu-tRNA(Gln) amidotransferase subunit GatC [Holosporales bacterium]|jgi:aspartyl-tRNA(Asn)/glutamyl-tRNA(Gln) amidotransferase subunit C|nr:Asp-tRNA(Asn)/Glu-tRNA(Gln) amidotransferase subunit GatC [Holosporales bacterium]
MSRITEAEVERVARLARLRCEEKDLPAMAKELSQVLAFVEKLNELPMADSTAPISLNTQAPLREDIVGNVPSAEALLANAPQSAFSLFSVPKVIE